MRECRVTLDLALAGSAFVGQRVPCPLEPIYTSLRFSSAFSANSEALLHTMLTQSNIIAGAELSGVWLSRLQQIGRRGEWQQALQCLQEVPADVALEVVYSMAITACGRSLQWQWCLKLLWDLSGQQNMVRAVRATQHSTLSTASSTQSSTPTTPLLRPVRPVPNIVVVGSALGALQKASKWKQASALLAWFWWSRVEANKSNKSNTIQNSKNCMVLCNCVMASFASASKWQGARSLLQNCQSDSVQPDEVTYTILMNSEKTTQWQAALSLLQLDCCAQPDIIVYNAAMSSFNKSALWRVSQILLNDISRAKVQREAVSFNTAASACEKAQQWQLATQSVGSLGSLGIQADIISFNTVIRASVRRPGETWQACWKLLDQLQQVHLQADLLLLNAMTETSEWQLTLVLLQKTRHEWSEQSEQTGQRSLSGLFNSVISACGRATWARAQNLLQNSKACNHQVEVVPYTSIVGACTSGNWPIAQAILEELHFRRIEEDVIACSAAMKACDAVGEWRQALSVLTNFRNKKLQADVIAYNASISACAKAVQWQQAQQVLLALQFFRICINTATLSTLLNAHPSREWQKANEFLAQSEADLSIHLSILSTASTLFDRAGEQLSATRFLSSVEATCRSEFQRVQYRRVGGEWMNVWHVTVLVCVSTCSPQTHRQNVSKCLNMVYSTGSVLQAVHAYICIYIYTDFVHVFYIRIYKFRNIQDVWYVGPHIWYVCIILHIWLHDTPWYSMNEGLSLVLVQTGTGRLCAIHCMQL